MGGRDDGVQGYRGSRVQGGRRRFFGPRAFLHPCTLGPLNPQPVVDWSCARQSLVRSHRVFSWNMLGAPGRRAWRWV